MKRLSHPAQRVDEAPVLFWNTVEIVVFNINDVLYQNCSTLRCNKRVDPVARGGLICSGCLKQAKTFDWRFSLTLKVRDSTQELQMSAFGEVCMKPWNKTYECVAP